MSDTTCLPWAQTTANWIVVLSFIPNSTVQTGAMVLSIVIATARMLNMCRPKNLNSGIETALRDVEEKIHDALERHLLLDSNVHGGSAVEARLKMCVLVCLSSLSARIIRSSSNSVSTFELQNSARSRFARRALHGRNLKKCSKGIHFAFGCVFELCKPWRPK
jgi:hypothetical protein